MAGRIGGEKTRCGNTWTEAKFKSFIKGNLRRITTRWQPIQDCLKQARTRRGFYLCAGCNQEVPASVRNEQGKRVKGIYVDHINPIVDIEKGFTSWDDVINGMFCEADNLQALCYTCHSGKSAEEAAERKHHRSNRKLHPREESSYRNMMSRCNNPNATGYQYYGGKGIKVCDRWMESFENFYEDMGDRPEGTSLDRIDYDSDYSPDNCRWATYKQQGQNKSDNHYISYDGKTQTIQEWADELNILSNTILYRIRRGWPVEEALEFKEREKPHLSRISKETWAEIQALRDDGHTTVALSKMFGIDCSQISRKTVNNKSDEEKAIAKLRRDKLKEEDIDE